ncbi:Fe-S cluster assembly protein SufD [Olivibacter sp. XZL3]|uniref:Fe-S cluster assembly protein SufD n=1 Tax=Olivibacter sp. XZL3 TaxID=1735116 RepID=UPI0010646341|nr:Fe-S cluster assembly protein SufD [Olivibacter sp. XZL3]
MITQVSSSLYHQLVAFFEEELPLKGYQEPLGSIRKEAFARFKDSGFPSLKMEDWKYTNLQPLINQHYRLNDSIPGRNVNIDKAVIGGLDTYRLVLVNGHYRKDLSDTITDSGVVVCAIEDGVTEHEFLSHFAKYADRTDNPLVALNTALHEGGLYIHIGKNVTLKKSVQIIHVASADEAVFNQARNLFVLDENAEAEIIESFISNDHSVSLNNTVSELVLKEGARLQHYYLQVADEKSRYLNHTEVKQARHSLYNNYNCSFPGSSFIRNNINVRLDDTAVESHLYGVTLTAQDQLVDNHTIVDHRMPHCESYEWYKNIAQDTSTAVFNGKIFVQPDAQKTNAFQQNNNMLIGDKANIFTKPQLEIFADDVKCSHGCTMGQFDEDALFYLKARGVGEASARVLLVHAFAFDVTEKFSNTHVRAYVDSLIERGLVID